MRRLHGARRWLKPWSTPMCSSTLPGWLTEAWSSRHPKQGFRCGFPNTTTSASMGRRLHTGRGRQARLLAGRFPFPFAGKSAKEPSVRWIRGGYTRRKAAWRPILFKDLTELGNTEFGIFLLFSVNRFTFSAEDVTDYLGAGITFYWKRSRYLAYCLAIALIRRRSHPVLIWHGIRRATHSNG